MPASRITTVACALVLVCASASSAQALRAKVYASGFDQPVAFVQDPSDPQVQFVVEKTGRIRVLKAGVVQPNDFLNLGPFIAAIGEQGLLGLAFGPDYADTRRFYVDFTDLNGNTVVARFKRSVSNPLVADPLSRFDLGFNGPDGPRYIPQPFANHNGGNLMFGPTDGCLYIGMGDGGSANDPDHRAQTPTDLMGKMLRIHPHVPDDDPVGYMVLPDSPFIGGGGPVGGTRPEVWAYGLRNPWRFSFDDPAHGGTGALIIGDVGQGSWEEIDYQPAGKGARNYGWRDFEGNHANVTSIPLAYQPHTPPIFEYSHAVGQSITGGFVYRGAVLGPAWRGRYFFADFVQGRVFSLALAIDGAGEATASDFKEHTAELAAEIGGLGNISSFGVDAAAELYIVSFSRGEILRVDRGAIPPPTNLRIIKSR
jgi:glucose/arabinose dehydrogenase